MRWSVETQKGNIKVDTTITNLEKKLTDIETCLPEIDTTEKAQNTCDQKIIEATSVRQDLQNTINTLTQDQKEMYRDDLARLQTSLNQLKGHQTVLKK